MNNLLMVIMNLGSIFAHMALVEPAPRRSPQHPGYLGGLVDYDMSSPLGGEERTFPCRGAPKGPNYKSYAAGSNIQVHINGEAKHMGGHCQFSLTYDEINFVVLKTVLGNCIIDTVDYKVLIPKDAPSSNVTFAWTWFNKIGNREMYMNCVDIEIKSNIKSGSIKGPKMVIANLPGYPTFEEGFADDYMKDFYDSQPIQTIFPKNTFPDASTKPTITPKLIIKPEPTLTPKPTKIIKPTAMSKPTTTNKPTIIHKPSTTKLYVNKKYPKPNLTYCIRNTKVCKDSNTIAHCSAKKLISKSCSRGTQCRIIGGMARCVKKIK